VHKFTIEKSLFFNKKSFRLQRDESIVVPPKFKPQSMASLVVITERNRSFFQKTAPVPKFAL